MARSFRSAVRANARVTVWLACLTATLCAWVPFLAVLYRIRSAREFFLYPSPSLASAVLLLSALLWAITAWNARLLEGWRWAITVLALGLTLPAGLALAIFLSAHSPAGLSSIRETNGNKVMLGIEPAWDVRAYALYDSEWGGLAWRARRDDGAVFWEYPYEGEMKLGLDRRGKAIILSPLGHPAPFPDGLSTVACPPGSPPRCVMPRQREEQHECPDQDKASALFVWMCDGPPPSRPKS
jgi:hypothetical protein